MNSFAPHALVAGTRFSLMNSEFEISFVDAATIRYSSCHGGNQYRVPLAVFWKMVDENSIGFLAVGKNGSSTAVNAPSSRILSDTAQAEMLRRYDYVRRTLAAPRAPLSRRNLLHAIQQTYEKHVARAHHAGGIVEDAPGVSTLARWVKRYVNSGGSPMALAPRSSKNIRRATGFSIEVETAISRALEMHLTDNRPSGVQTYCNLVGLILEGGLLSNGEKIPSKRTIYRRLASVDPYVKTLKRHGKRIADTRFRAAGIGFETSRAMQTVMIDGHHMDVIVVDEQSRETAGRANLVCLFDVETRTIVGWYISLLPFCSSSALAAIKDMCSRDPQLGPGGVPEAVTPDNGRDLVSNAILSLCSKIPMHFTPAKSYSPDDKAHLERFFRTLNEQLVHMIPGSTFSSPRQRGNYDSQGMACCTLTELRELFRKWVNEVYHKNIHSATSRAPLLAWRDRQAESPAIHFSAAEIDMFARIPYPRKINNGRVLLDHLFYKSHVLATWEVQGKKDVVVLSDELDLSFVYVYHPDEPEKIVRADCTKAKYASSLTKFEHDQVRAQLRDQAVKDRQEVGDFAYEVARWKMWNEIQGMKTQRAARKLARLRSSIKAEASASYSRNNDISRKFDEDRTGISGEHIGIVIPRGPEELSVEPTQNMHGDHDDLDTFEIAEGD
ncbi:DDE-type integrase/transposase/recombinase [Pseudoduganella sp. FT25W]|uniref:DDE-type integrase/transposase/recombinase n=1 Tax=Duganella alba TaxID=2666081 RepID=A0A6L5QEH6_9BURK|nr:Mu transposase C-terminal domain-containing protein [Duganella alba]MRX08143.1 DDE-type integrase/transposase/recombinase [Duganella alba]MRX16320.1 DDE-type integrase/transposase/recombinase [Duganella alba]